MRIYDNMRAWACGVCERPLLCSVTVTIVLNLLSLALVLLSAEYSVFSVVRSVPVRGAASRIVRHVSWFVHRHGVPFVVIYNRDKARRWAAPAAV